MNKVELQAVAETLNNLYAREEELKQAINYIFKDIGNLSYDEIKAKLSFPIRPSSGSVPYRMNWIPSRK